MLDCGKNHLPLSYISFGSQKKCALAELRKRRRQPSEVAYLLPKLQQRGWSGGGVRVRGSQEAERTRLPPQKLTSPFGDRSKQDSRGRTAPLGRLVGLLTRKSLCRLGSGKELAVNGC